MVFDASAWNNMLHGVGCSFSNPENGEDCWKNEGNTSIFGDDQHGPVVDEPIPIHPTRWSRDGEWSKKDGDFLTKLFGPEEDLIAENISIGVLDSPSIGNWCHSGMDILGKEVSSPCPFRHDETIPQGFEENNNTSLIMQPVVLDCPTITYPSPFQLTVLPNDEQQACSSKSNVTEPDDTAAPRQRAPKAKNKQCKKKTTKTKLVAQTKNKKNLKQKPEKPIATFRVANCVVPRESARKANLRWGLVEEATNNAKKEVLRVTSM